MKCLVSDIMGDVIHFDPTVEEVDKIYNIMNRMAFLPPNEKTQSEEYLKKQWEQDPLYEPAHNKIMERAVDEQNVAVLQVAVMLKAKASKSTMNYFRENMRYEDEDYEMLRLLLASSREPFDVGPMQWIDVWNEMLVKAATQDKTHFVKLYFIHKPDTFGLGPGHNYYVHQLALVAEKASVATVQVFIEYEARIKGSSAMARAARAGKLEMVKLLLWKGSNVNESDSWYVPPSGSQAMKVGNAFHEAILGGHKKIVKLLIREGADLNLNYIDGRTPLDLAKGTKNKKVIAMVESYLKK